MSHSSRGHSRPCSELGSLLVGLPWPAGAPLQPCPQPLYPSPTSLFSENRLTTFYLGPGLMPFPVRAPSLSVAKPSLLDSIPTASPQGSPSHPRGGSHLLSEPFQDTSSFLPLSSMGVPRRQALMNIGNVQTGPQYYPSEVSPNESQALAEERIRPLPVAIS